jgi:MraZ protein
MVRSLNGSCIEVYPAREWERREDKIAAAPQSHRTLVSLKRFQVAGAGVATPDGHGRVLLPLSLRAYAGIESSSEVVVVGQIHHFELWNHSRWQQEQQAVIDDVESWRSLLPDLGL